MLASMQALQEHDPDSVEQAGRGGAGNKAAAVGCMQHAQSRCMCAVQTVHTEGICLLHQEDQAWPLRPAALLQEVPNLQQLREEYYANLSSPMHAMIGGWQPHRCRLQRRALHGGGMPCWHCLACPTLR